MDSVFGEGFHPILARGHALEVAGDGYTL